MSQWTVEYGVWVAGGRIMPTSAVVDATSPEAAIAEAARLQDAADARRGRANVGYFAKATATPAGRGGVMEPRQQPREHPVQCSRCGRLTLNVTAVCDRHPIR